MNMPKHRTVAVLLGAHLLAVAAAAGAQESPIGWETGLPDSLGYAPGNAGDALEASGSPEAPPSAAPDAAPEAEAYPSRYARDPADSSEPTATRPVQDEAENNSAAVPPEPGDSRDAPPEPGESRILQPLPDELAPDTNMVPLRVILETEGPEGTVPHARAEVLVHVLRPPHDLVASWQGTTDTAGELVLDVPTGEGLQAFAQVPGDRSFFSEVPVPLDGDGPFETRIRVDLPAADLSTVVVRNLTTIIEPWEGHLAVTQVWTLATTDGRVFRPADNDPRSAVRIPFMHGATSLQVLDPEDGIERRDGFLLYRGPVLPGASDPRLMTRVVLRFSVQTRNAPSFHLEQPVSMDVHSGSVLLPMTTTFSRHPIIDVRVDAPLCTGDATPCFERRITHDPEGLLRDGVPVRGLSGLTASAGDILSLETHGWPSASRWERTAAIIAGILGLLLGLVALFRVRGLGRGGRAARRWQVDALLAQRDALLEEAAHIEAAWGEGELLEAEIRLAREQLREELAILLRRLRELRALDEQDSRSGEPDPAATGAQEPG